MEEDLNFGSSEITTLNSLSVDDYNTILKSTTDSVLSSCIPTITSTLSTSMNGYWGGPYDSNSISISDSIFNSSNNRIKIDEILNDMEKFCKEKCFFGLENICDGEIKCECPLWNRLKCEKRV